MLPRFARSSYRELGDFVDQCYECLVEETGDRLRIHLKRDGHLKYDRRFLPFRVEKELSLVSGKDELGVEYVLTNTGDAIVQGVFGTEWNINLLGGGHNDQTYYEVPGLQFDDWHLDSTGELSDVEELALGNRQLGIEIRLKLSQKVRLWRFPVEAICNSESGLERVYQGSCLILLLPFSLAHGESLQLGLSWLPQH